jgi:hypothetical protein
LASAPGTCGIQMPFTPTPPVEDAGSLDTWIACGSPNN